MKAIPLTQGLFALVDNSDYTFLMRWNWCASKHDNKFYAIRSQGSVKNKTRQYVYMHRVIAGAAKGQKVDHWDRCTLNNQRENLRLCSFRQNSANKNRQSNNKSGLKGVWWDKEKRKWTSQVLHKFLGRFDTAEEAARAYDLNAKRTFGDFAATNESLGLIPKKEEAHA